MLALLGMHLRVWGMDGIGGKGTKQSKELEIRGISDVEGEGYEVNKS